MGRKTIEVIEEFDPAKKYKFHVRKQLANVLRELRKGNRYEVASLIEQYDGIVTKKKNPANTKDVIKQVVRIGKDDHLIIEIDDKPISFENFCKLDSISYMRKQLTATKYRNPDAKTKHSGGGTRRSYSLLLWHFNNWLHGKSITIQKATLIEDNLQRIERVSVNLDTVEDLLLAYQDNPNSSAEFERFVKQYLYDPEIQKNKSKGYMRNIVSAIQAYFKTNESPIKIHFNYNVNHEEISEQISENVSALSLDEFHELLTTGKPSIIEKAVALCKFHSGTDNSTFVDRLNFEAWPQLVKWFGTDNYEYWDLTKCPVMIRISRLKVGFPHNSCLDKDAIKAMQTALKWRESKTGKPMKIGEAIFLNTKLKPITDRWVSELIPRLAERAGIQKRFETKNGKRNEKTSHELRDTLKSTLRSCGVADYACEHLIGHTPRDSYEKESILYPEKIREEFMKASKMLNIFTGFTNYVKRGDDSEHLREKLAVLEKDMSKMVEEKVNDGMDAKLNEKMNEVKQSMQIFMDGLMKQYNLEKMRKETNDS